MKKFNKNNFINKEYKDALDQTAIVSKSDLNGNITYVNDNLCRITGYSKEELIGKPHSILKHDDADNETFEELWNTILNKRVWKGELKNKKKDGSLYIVNATIIPQFDNDEIIGFIGIRYNITELIEQRELTQKILDAQKEIFILGNKIEGIKIVNKKFYKDLGFISLAHYYSKCKNLSDLILNIDEIDNLKIERLRNFENVEINNIKIESNGKIKNYNLFLNSMNNNEYIITLNDITKLSSLIDKAKNESFMKSNFLATMSHEIRTPLNGIIPYIEYLLDTELSKEQKEKLEIIYNSSHSLLRVINDILDFSKIESGKLEIELTQFNPVSEIESVVNLYSAKTFEKNIQFCAFIDPKLPNYLKGDILRIKQIINNLLSNAIKFTPIGGEIDLNFELLNIIKNKAIIEIFVKDTGIGISKENQKLMFKPFSQESSSITRNFGGTGLGLSISQQLAKMMNSKILLESDINQGSKFSFTLELDIVETCILKETYFNKNICIHIANKEYSKCMKVLIKYLNRFNIKHKIISNKDEILSNDNILFIISSGHDEIKWLDDSFSDKKVISIIPNAELNSNNFYYNHIVTMPLNGSKIFDTIVDDNTFKPIQKKIKTINDFYNAHVLVAEDNATNRTIVKLLLNKQKIEVSFAENGVEAISFYEKKYKNIDLIFMDIHMPKMDGKDATKHIRNFERENNLKEIPIVALTADAIKEHQTDFISAGMNKVLSKPIENDKFHQILREFLKELSIKNQLTSSTLNNKFISYIEIIKKELEVDSSVAEMLLESFRDDWKKLKIELENAFNNKDTTKLKGLFHQLKGSSGGLKFIEIFDLCKKYEMDSFNNKLIDLNDFELFIKKLNEI